MTIRGTETDRLNDVIQSLQLVRKSGLLTVERTGVNNFPELGTIMFQNGKVIDARLGNLQGTDAFKIFSAWTICRFLFEPATSPISPYSSSQHPPFPTTGVNLQREEQRSQTQRSSSANNMAPIIPRRIPFLQGELPDFQRLGLSRIHRQLFLLIDGKRSVQEMAKIIGRHPQDVINMLNDLGRAGLIN